MSEEFEFELIFALPEGEHDPVELSNAVFEAGFEDAVVGTGLKGLLGVEIVAEGDDADAVIKDAARALIRHFPEGSELHEVRPDLVSISDVAEHLAVKRQALAQRGLPRPVAGDRYRITDIADQIERWREGVRKARMDIERARPWLRSGHAASMINVQIATRKIDPVTITERDASPDEVA